MPIADLATPAPDATPRVWLLLGHRVGDEMQLTSLAEGLGWPYEIKWLTYNGLCKLPNVLLGASRASLARPAWGTLAPPWPDLVLMIGRRSVPIGRWIRARSGGRTRLVQFGRPRAPATWFDLIVTTPQYRLPPAPNVLHNLAPLHRADAAAMASAAAKWRGRLDHLPRPLIALLAGGDSAPYRLDAATARRLGQAASAAAAGGSLLVTSSYRMRNEAVDALFAAVSVPAELYRWRAGDPENPYFAYVALADSFIVTGESISMLTEACDTGKPVYIFDLPRRDSRWARWLEAAYGQMERRRQARATDRLVRGFDLLVEYGLLVLPRDFGAIHDRLIAAGHAAWLGDPPPDGQPEPGRDLARAVAHVQRIILAEAADRGVDGVQPSS